MNKIKVCYIVSRISKSFEYEWLSERLDPKRFELKFILLHNEHTPFEEYLAQNKVPYRRISYFDKRDLPAAIWKIWRILKKEKPDIINCNLVDAQLAGLTAGWLAGISNRIYTRHHSVYHHYYAKQGVWYDRLSDRLASRIVAITGLVKRVLVEMEGVNPEKVEVIPYGFDFSEYGNIEGERIEKLKDKYKLKGGFPVIGVISRYTYWKGLQYIIPAFGNLKKRYPEAMLVLAGAGGGDMADEIKQLLSNIPEGSYREVPFENDVAGLFACFDVFLHTPVDDWVEAFGRIYVEALASKVPSVFTMSGIAHDFIKNRINALVVDYQNTAQIVEAVSEILENPELRASLIHHGRMDVQQNFTLEKNIGLLENMYDKIMN